MFMTTHYMDEAEWCDRIAINRSRPHRRPGHPRGAEARVGGDVVTLSTDDDARAAKEIAQRLDVTPSVDGTGLHIEVADGAPSCPG